MASIKDNLDGKANEFKQGLANKTNEIQKGIADTTKGIKDGYEDKKKAIAEDLAQTKQKIGTSIDTGKRVVTSFVKKLLIAAFVLSILAGVGYYLFASMVYSDGSRTGQLIKISEKGYVFKTYEGSLSLGGISVEDDKTNIGSIWEFSVLDEAVFQKMISLRGKKVVVQYEEKYRVIPWKGDTKYLISVSYTHLTLPTICSV